MKTSGLKFDPNLRKDWLVGILPKKWKKEYPDLFDKDDLRIALSQPQYHFYEWVVAIHYYKKGYNVLVEQYIYESHQGKLNILKKIIGEDGVSFLKKLSKDLKSQPSDLFVYKGYKFFFVEVKAPKDRLHKQQEKLFKRIENKLKTEVIILNLRQE